MNFNLCIGLCDHHHQDQDTELLLTPNICLVLSLCSHILFHPYALATTSICSLSLQFCLFESYITELIQFVMFRDRHLSFSIMKLSGFVCISSSIHFY